jgi:hypothetical protein
LVVQILFEIDGARHLPPFGLSISAAPIRLCEFNAIANVI